jgi:hypothetical protein
LLLARPVGGETHPRLVSDNYLADDASISRVGRRVAALEGLVVAERHVLLLRWLWVIDLILAELHLLHVGIGQAADIVIR